MTHKDYHSQENETRYMRNSQYKNWLRCQAETLAVLRGEWERPITDALLVGSMVDAALTTPEDYPQWKTDHAADILGKNGKTLAAYVGAEAMIERVKADLIYRDIVASAESQVILTGTIGDHEWSYMADWIVKGKTNPVILDLKTCPDFAPTWAVQEEPGATMTEHIYNNKRVPWYDAKGYWRQLAIGRHLYHQMHGVWPVCGLLAVSKPKKRQYLGGREQLGAIGLQTVYLVGHPDEIADGHHVWTTQIARCEREIARLVNDMVHIGPVKAGLTPATGCGDYDGDCEYCRSKSTFERQNVGVSMRLYSYEG